MDKIVFCKVEFEILLLGFPDDFNTSILVIQKAGERKQVITQTIEVFYHKSRYIFDISEVND
ncbi:MAG: hypothetical protein RIT42_881, partial [Bacteroidota bacterium]